jgi:hypothetical protein
MTPTCVYVNFNSSYLYYLVPLHMAMLLLLVIVFHSFIPFVTISIFVVGKGPVSMHFTVVCEGSDQLHLIYKHTNLMSQAPSPSNDVCHAYCTLKMLFFLLSP